MVQRLQWVAPPKITDTKHERIGNLIRHVCPRFRGIAVAKVIQLRGQKPGGWASDRWVWTRAVAADGRLLPMSRLVASVLAIGFANHETAECTPGIAALMKSVAASRSTVQRALADLQAVGWIECLGGSAQLQS